MSFTEKPRMRVGELLVGTLRQLASIPGPLAAYTAIFVGLAALTNLGQTVRGPISIISLIAYFVAQYWLYRKLLRGAGAMEVDDGMRVFRFAGMAIVLIVPIYIGAAFLLIPGIFLVSKWIIAPCYLVATPRGTFGSIGESWNASEGSTLAIGVTFSILMVVMAAGVGLVAVIVDSLGIGDFATSSGTVVTMHLLPLLLMGLSVTAFCELNGDTERLGDVFA